MKVRLKNYDSEFQHFHIFSRTSKRIFFSSMRVEAGMAAARQYEFNTGPINGWDHRHPAKSGPKVSPYELISSSLQIARNSSVMSSAQT